MHAFVCVHGPARPGPARHGPARHGPARHGTARQDQGFRVTATTAERAEGLGTTGPSGTAAVEMTLPIHNYIGHNYIGHNYTGHNHTCHDYAGTGAVEMTLPIGATHMWNQQSK